MNTETVNLKDRSYPIFIGKGASQEPEALIDRVKGSDVAIISDEVVAPLYLNQLLEGLPEKNIITYVLPKGEQEKKLKTVHKIIDHLLENGFGRDATLISLGGGVVCDITGFVASVFMRGVNVIQIPTTLLAQVDASVGGKTGVNHSRGKNLIGSFYQPSAVICDTTFLSSLNSKEMSDGLAEIIKYGLIYDRDFFVWLQSNVANILEQDRASLGHAVQRSCQIKAEIVAQDEKEQSIRAILNFGHTFGHAIENQTGYDQWSHGQAIAAGMVLASKLSAKMSLISKDDVGAVKDILSKAGLPVEPPKINVNDFIDAMKTDKKVKDRVIQLVLLKEIGNAFLTADYLEQDLEDILSGVM